MGPNLDQESDLLNSNGSGGSHFEPPKTIYNFVKIAIDTMVYASCRQKWQVLHVFEQRHRDRKSRRPDLLANRCGGVSILLSARKLFHHLSCSSRAWLCDVALTQNITIHRNIQKRNGFTRSCSAKSRKRNVFRYF